MKSAVYAFLFLALAPFASAEDSISCANGLSVALTDDSTVSVSGIRPHQELLRLEILQKGAANYVRIVNDKTVINDSRLLKVKLTIDNGTSIRSVVIFDWAKFSDGETVPVAIYSQLPNGDLELNKKIVCDAAQS